MIHTDKQERLEGGLRNQSAARLQETIQSLAQPVRVPHGPTEPAEIIEQVGNRMPFWEM